MDSTNVFIEVFGGELEPYMVPVAPEADVKKALAKVELARSAYEDADGNLLVPGRWLSHQSIDFADWLSSHRPSYHNTVMYRALMEAAPRFYGSLALYDSLEHIQQMLEDIQSNGGTSPYESNQAITAAEEITGFPDAMTVAFSCNGGEVLDTFYVPEPSFDDVEGPRSLPLTSDGVLAIDVDDAPGSVRECKWAECYAAAVECLGAGTGAMSVCRHAGGAALVAVLTFAHGKCWALTHEEIAAVVGASGGAGIGAGLASFYPETSFEGSAAALAADILASITEVLDTAVKVNEGPGGDNTAVVPFRLSPPVSSEGLGSEPGMNFLAEEKDLYSSLTRMFDDILDADPLMSGREASMTVAAAAESRAAAEIISTGTMDKVNGEVNDFATFRGLDDGSRSFDDVALAFIGDQADHIANESENAMLLSVYEELDGPRKAEIDDMADFISARGDEIAHVFSLPDFGAELPEEGPSEMKISSFLMMPRDQMPPEVADHATDLLHTLGMKASLSAQTTVLVRFQKPGAGSPEVSCLSWKGGSWADAGETAAKRLLFGTNIGDIMGVGYADDVTFRPAHKPSRGGAWN